MKLSAIIRIAAPVALVAAGMAAPVSAQPGPSATDYNRTIEGEVESILAGSADPCTRLAQVEQEIEDWISRVPNLLVDSVRAGIKDRIGERITALRRECNDRNGGDIFRPYPAFGEIGVASDSTTFCTFRPGNPEVIRVFSVPPPPADCPDGAEYCADCPDGAEYCEPEPNPDAVELPPTVPPPDDAPPGELPEPFVVAPQPEDPCERLEVLTARFLDLASSLDLPEDARDESDDIRSEQAIALLPEILLLRQRCPGPCEELRELRATLKEVENYLELVEDARRFGAPINEEEADFARASARVLPRDIAKFEEICPDLDPFFEQIERLRLDDETDPPTPDCEPGEPCGDLFTEEDPVPPDQEDPLPVNVPFSVPVKATSTALDSGERAEQIAGQVVVLLTPDQLNPELPQPGGERPQLGHDADRASGVTDENGRIDIAVDLTDFVPDLARSQTPDGGPGGAFEITVDTTARDGFIVTLPVGEPLGAQVSRLGLDRLLVSEIVVGPGIEADGGDTDPAQFGVFNGPTDQIDLARRIIVTAIPDAVIESDLCMIKEPASVTEYNGCDFGEEGPPPGMRVLLPPAPHAELPGEAIDLASAGGEIGS